LPDGLTAVRFERITVNEETAMPKVLLITGDAAAAVR
jgi:hypothetical protein